jgi:hypothetical protein
VLGRFFLLFFFFFILDFRFSWAKWQNWQSKPLLHRPFGKKQQRLQVPSLCPDDPIEGSGTFSEYITQSPKSSSDEEPSSHDSSSSASFSIACFAASADACAIVFPVRTWFVTSLDSVAACFCATVLAASVDSAAAELGLGLG